MGFFDFLKKQDFDAGLARFRAAAGALLLDVRDAVGSVNGKQFSFSCIVDTEYGEAEIDYNL